MQVYSFALKQFHKQMPFDHRPLDEALSWEDVFDKDHVLSSSCLFFPEKKMFPSGKA